MAVDHVPKECYGWKVVKLIVRCTKQNQHPWRAQTIIQIHVPIQNGQHGHHAQKLVAIQQFR